MHRLLVAALIASTCAPLVAQPAEPVLDSWRRNIDFTNGSCPSGDCYGMCALPLTLVETIGADIQSVRYTPMDVYVECTGVPSHPIGDWGPNPNCVMDQSYVFKIPRHPSPAGLGGHLETPLNRIGVTVSGVPIFNAKDAQSWMGFGEWFRNAVYFEAAAMDDGLGHPTEGNEYHHHQRPALLALQEGDNGVDHSPILGFAFDGFPIYGPYAFSNTDGTGGVRRMETSYRIRSISDRSTLADGTPSAFSYPPIDDHNPLGSYTDDYEYVAGLGDLDEHNGRDCVTPQYPAGTYAYFATIDSTGANQYPYVVGRTYFGAVECKNFDPASCPAGCGCTKPIPAGSPYAPFTLYETGLTGGGIAKPSIGLAAPGDKLWLGVSLTGEGPTPSKIGKIALSAPITFIGPVPAGPGGGFTLSGAVSSAWTGLTIHLQAFRWDGATYHMSNADRVVIN